MITCIKYFPEYDLSQKVLACSTVTYETFTHIATAS